MAIKAAGCIRRCEISDQPSLASEAPTVTSYAISGLVESVDSYRLLFVSRLQVTGGKDKK